MQFPTYSLHFPHHLHQPRLAFFNTISRILPFRHATSNTVETVSLCVLLIVSTMNLVKATFYHAQSIPRDAGYRAIVVFEWLEALAVALLPLCIVLLVLAHGFASLYAVLRRCWMDRYGNAESPDLLKPEEYKDYTQASFTCIHYI